MISVRLQKKKSVISYAIFVQLYCALTWSLYLIIWAYVFDRTISFRAQERWQLLDGEARDVEAVLEAHFYLYCKIFCYAEAKMVTPFMFVSSVLVVSLQYLLRFIADKFWMRKWTLTLCYLVIQEWTSTALSLKYVLSFAHAVSWLIQWDENSCYCQQG